MEMKKKKIPLGLIVMGALLAILAVYYIYVHLSTTPEEEAYAAAVQKVVEYFDEKNQKAQKQENEGEEDAKSYVEEIAKEKEAETHPYFDKYREKYVKKDGDGYLVELPVQEMKNDKVVKESVYEIQVKENDGNYAVTSMDRKEKK